MLPMSHHAGPTRVSPTPGPKKAPKGRRGNLEKVRPGSKQPRKHEVRAPRPRAKRGLGKIKTTGKSRYEHFTSRSKF